MLYKDDGVFDRDIVVPCRGRRDLPGTNNFDHTLTKRDLDAIAPLEPWDSRDMGEYSCPSPETVDRVDARIRAAHRLKYGVQS